VSETADLARRLGDALGDGYAVEGALGEGGFAVVFLVRDLALKRKLAVKVLSPDLITSKTVLERFRREAETVAQLSHPNIVPLHFIGQRDELLYLAMPCIEGGSIGDRLEKEGPLPVADVERVIGEVAGALAYAHKRGVIHRDIKPANVLVDTETGRCLVTDFGIARTDAGGNLTATGMMLGSPPYLAPEQVTGEGLDHRVDIFALGVMAYELLAGRLPFEGPTPTAAMMKRLAGPPAPVATIRPDVPKELSALIQSCLAADPAARVQQASDIVAVLAGAPAAMSATRAAPPATRSRVPLIVAGVVLAAVAGAAALMGDRSTVPPAAATPSSLVAIPAGQYPVGTDRGLAAARPHHVEQVAAFAIERTEVTVGAYRAFVAATGAPLPPGTASDPMLPVTGVRYAEAERYCAWKYPDGGRLPTEVEWEAAARGTAGREYPYGDAAVTGAANTASARRATTVPVGSYPRGATPDGVQDLSGNVWEWTSSPGAAYPGAAALAISPYTRVIRGGAFNTPDSLATAWMRAFYPEDTPPDKLPNTGFRCVRGGGR
jgi:formylglycine-generating enzyme required for sulfatase activity/tRNA A-37 threonylcarbamoyl transferase component Bud32